ncbi:RND family efflux transporter, MFP subunit [bacterium A37T11]|nr:RND family efflux transporter, MFP subunit [bacterium A37T11]
MSNNLLLVGTGIWLCVACQHQDKQVVRADQPIPVKIVNLGESAANVEGLIYSGTIAPEKEINLGFQAGGRITSISVSMGQYVAKGQLIATIDDAVYRSQYEAQKAQADLASENYQRILTVFNKGSIAEIKMIEARQQAEQARAAAAASREQLSYARLYAPAAGYINAKLADVGDMMAAGTPVVQLLDISSVKVQVTIPEGEINQFRVGNKGSVELPALGNKVLQGNISEVSVSSAQGSPVYTVNIGLPNHQKELKPGMVANVSFKKNGQVYSAGSDSSAKVVVPLQSVQVDEKGQQFVYITSADQKKALRKTVKTGEMNDRGFAIQSGLQSGEKLIVSGYHKLTDGSLITVIP